tara:strand:- start:1415 stop:1861 length:447 start_codon:yes stop_codon:yes gene_type:complete
MIIDCPVCNKKFDIDQDLIPTDGRLLQCGSCNHKWFFKLNINEKKSQEEIKIKPKKDFNINVESTDKNLKKEINVETEEIIPKKKKEKKSINYLNIILVIIISTTAFILVLDTFKNQLTSVFPNIKFLLNNLYQSIEDIKLFILDLIK